MTYYRLRLAYRYHVIATYAAELFEDSPPIALLLLNLPVFLLAGTGLIAWHLPLVAIVLGLVLSLLPAGFIVTYLVKYTSPNFDTMREQINRLHLRRAAIKANPALAKVPSSLIDSLYQID